MSAVIALVPSWVNIGWVEDLTATAYERLPTAGTALGVMIGGWILAYIIHKIVYAGLKRTTISRGMAKLLGAGVDEDSDHIERAVSKIVYYILLAFVAVWFFDYLEIDAVTQPVVTVLNEFAGAVPNLTKALVIGFIGFLFATGIRRVLLGVLDKMGLEARMRKLSGESEAAGDERPIAETVAGAAYWFVLIVAAIPVLEALKIGALAEPLSAAFTTVTTYLPKIAGAIVLLVVGYTVARIVRAIVAGVLERVGLDRAMNRVGFDRVLKESTISGIIGSIVMAFVLLQFAISAVGRLEIQEVSEPLTLMLEKVYSYFPKLLVGTLLMAIGVMIARVTSNVASRLLAAMGFNTLLVHIGVFKTVSKESKQQELDWKKAIREKMRPSDAPGASEASEADSSSDLLRDRESDQIQTPADVGGLIIGAVVVLLFLQQVLKTLELHGLAGMLDGLLAFLPSVLVAAVLIGAGLWSAGWARKRVDELTHGNEDRVARSLGSFAYAGTVGVSIMMALQQVGVANQLFGIAFGLVLGSVCLALSLAFGLGGRDVAGRILQKEYERQKRR